MGPRRLRFESLVTNGGGQVAADDEFLEVRV
ncbi:hypothetical protein COLO4_13634 [Corchorus olitorius]|uniref:Uncharacterized protein n=1 Tax=Corchorus olitorius TaxID=93759 RepID=A0A1R3JW61_9ROSI|nr:hypothetical protein COLO4_13634 [Corchorus olitorius]